MKNLLFVLYVLIFVANCSSNNKNLSLNNFKEDNSGNSDNFKFQINEDCIYDIDNVEIFQTFNKNTGLATYDRGKDIVRKQYMRIALFSLPITFWDEIKIYDGLRIKVPEGQCFVIRDTYEYKAKSGDNKVVPIITFDYEYEPKTTEELIERIEKVKQKICHFNSKKEMKEQGFKSIKQCECYTETAYDVDNLMKLKNNEVNEDELIKQMEKKCGKLQTANTTRTTAKTNKHNS